MSYPSPERIEHIIALWKRQIAAAGLTPLVDEMSAALHAGAITPDQYLIGLAAIQRRASKMTQQTEMHHDREDQPGPTDEEDRRPDELHIDPQRLDRGHD